MIISAPGAAQQLLHQQLVYAADKTGIEQAQPKQQVCKQISNNSISR
jgi:hypothetical protein